MAVIGGVLFGIILALIGELTATPPSNGPAAPGAVDAPGGAGAAAGAERPEARFRRLVDFGNRCYDEGTLRLKRSDPAENPDGWAAENEAALELLGRAVDYYNEALELRQENYLVNRIRDANFKRMAARKRMLDGGGGSD
jgi:hypothetical protein